MRGAEGGFGDLRHWFGITPAYAGSSFQSRLRKHVQRDHPRVCGEQGPMVEDRLNNMDHRVRNRKPVCDG